MCLTAADCSISFWGHIFVIGISQNAQYLTYLVSDLVGVRQPFVQQT